MNTNPTRPNGSPDYFLGRGFATWRAALERGKRVADGRAERRPGDERPPRDRTPGAP